MLRCGYCGAAMMPRNDHGHEYYVCRTKVETGGKDACPMRAIRRTAVELPVLRMFEDWALDIDGTRRNIEEQLDARVTVARQQAERAARELAEGEAQIARATRDYEAGELGPLGYERQLGRWTDATEAATAERDRLTAHADELATTRADLDSEHETLSRLAELRAAVAQRVGNAAGRDLGSLRAALARVFDHVA
jgi:Recombinase zinc beta ribbon domain